MSLPFYLPIGDGRFTPHLFFELLAFFVAFRYFLYLRRRQEDPIDTTGRLWIIVGAAAGALLGSRLLGTMENWPCFVSGGCEQGWLYYYANKTIVGGLLGGLFGVELTKKLIGVSQSSGDLFTYPILLGMIIGRIGCFLAGIEDGTHGIETTMPWGMDMGDGLSRHPAALYEILFLGILWISLRKIEHKWQLKNGDRFKLFMVAYLLFRFFIDFLKPVYTFSFGLMSIQIACLLGLGYYGWGLREKGPLR